MNKSCHDTEDMKYCRAVKWHFFLLYQYFACNFQPLLVKNCEIEYTIAVSGFVVKRVMQTVFKLKHPHGGI